MKAKFTLLIIGLAMTIFSCSQKQEKCETDAPTELIENFVSYQSIGDFESMLKSKIDTMLVFEDSKLEENDPRPEFSTYTVIIPDYHIENAKGELRASFYNDRLMTISFYPKDTDRFVQRLDDEYQINLRTKENKIFGCLKILRWRDFEGNEFFDWSDIRLLEERLEWVNKYS